MTWLFNLSTPHRASTNTISCLNATIGSQSIIYSSVESLFSDEIAQIRFLPLVSENQAELDFIRFSLSLLDN